MKVDAVCNMYDTSTRTKEGSRCGRDTHRVSTAAPRRRPSRRACPSPPARHLQPAQRYPALPCLVLPYSTLYPRPLPRTSGVRE